CRSRSCWATGSRAGSCAVRHPAHGPRPALVGGRVVSGAGASPRGYPGDMKIAAFDIDDTLLFPHGIAEEDIAAIRAWQEAGHLAVAATGKSLSALGSALQPYDLTFDYSVAFTGAGVADRE